MKHLKDFYLPPLRADLQFHDFFNRIILIFSWLGDYSDYYSYKDSSPVASTQDDALSKKTSTYSTKNQRTSREV